MFGCKHGKATKAMKNCQFVCRKYQAQTFKAYKCVCLHLPLGYLQYVNKRFHPLPAAFVQPFPHLVAISELVVIV